MTIIRTFRTRNFTVTVSAEEDCDIDLSWDETGEVRQKLESGELQSFMVKAECSFDGGEGEPVELATAYLGGCIYANPREFMDHKGIRHYCPPGGRPGQCGSYFSDMVRSVCRDGRKAFADLQSRTAAVSLR